MRSDLLMNLPHDMFLSKEARAHHRMKSIAPRMNTMLPKAARPSERGYLMLRIPMDAYRLDERLPSLENGVARPHHRHLIRVDRYHCLVPYPHDGHRDHHPKAYDVEDPIEITRLSRQSQDQVN